MASNSTDLLVGSPFFQSLRQSQYAFPVRPNFLASSSFRLANPRNHVVNTDKVTQILPASAIAGLSDENVLGLFSKGFFGGFIFSIERTMLWFAGGKLLPSRYTGFDRPANAVTIWNKSDIPSFSLLPKGTSLYGSFTITDKYIASAPTEEDASYVDYSFGSDQYSFAGCHRFQITRLPTSSSGEKEEPKVQVELLHFRCNPQENKPSVAEYIETFHYVYAKTLFANGIHSIMNRSNSGS